MNCVSKHHLSVLILYMLYKSNAMDVDKEARLSSCMHSYHIYNAIWSATVGEELQRVKKLEMRRTDMQSSFHKAQI